MHTVLSTFLRFLRSKTVFFRVWCLSCLAVARTARYSVVVGASDFRSEDPRVDGARSPSCRFVSVETRNFTPHCLSQPWRTNGCQRKLSEATHNGLAPHPDGCGDTTKCCTLDRNQSFKSRTVSPFVTAHTLSSSRGGLRYKRARKMSVLSGRVIMGGGRIRKVGP